MSRIVLATAAVAALCGANDAWARQKAPKLSKGQRTTLEALVAAVDRASAVVDPALATAAASSADADAGAIAATWQSHVMRASDGSHYVAVRALVPGVSATADPVPMYVRLATRRSETAVAERSAVREWLAGLRGDPLPMQAGRSVSVPQGEMPFGGAAATSRRAGEAVDATSALRLLSMQQERAAREKADQDARRLAALEQDAGGQTSTMLPFEDFDFEARPITRPGGGVDIRRGVTAGPGTYDLFIAWMTGPAKGATAHVVRQQVTLPAAVQSFGLSDIIVAESVMPLATPYASASQGAHAYAIGALDVTPAIGNALDAGGTLGLVFQVINPAGLSGMPSVDVRFQVSRVVGDRLVAFGALETQHYGEANLPADFDATKGHPLFGAVRASLATFPRGRYRVEVTAVDQVASRIATAYATFDVRGTPESLLREAPGPGQAFRRDSLLTPGALALLTRALQPDHPSDALATALAAGRAGRFAELVSAGTVVAAERPVVQTLIALGLYGLGDSPRAVATQLSLALAQGAPPAPARLLLGAAMAMSADDKGAIMAWTEARDRGLDAAVVSPLLTDAYLRQGDLARAATEATATLTARPEDRDARRALAATFIATRRFGEAIRLLDDAPVSSAPDPDTDFLLVHALYAGHVTSAAGNAGDRARLQTIGQRYIDAQGRHAGLVKEWFELASAAAPR